jgi:hypothetical protein
MEDLNIDNYNLEDILHLFKIPFNFTEEDMKKAKKMVLKTHPDKSKLSPEYFLFYSKAYKKLYGIYEFKNKSKKDQNTEYDNELETTEKEKSHLLTKYLEKNKLKEPKKFNDWFNREFEKNKIKDDKGYGEWFKSSEGMENINPTIKSNADMNIEIEKHKKKLRDQSLIQYKGVEEMFFSTNATLLSEDTNDNHLYSSDMFSNLGYEDLRKAHTETIIPVTMDDYQRIPKFRSVNDYNQHRSSGDMNPLSEEQALKFLDQKHKMIEEESTKTAYYYAKKMEENEKINNKFWSSIRNIKNV